MLIIAGFDTISFGFYVALNALTPVWLQTPKKFGGIYGFTVEENAACELTGIAGYLQSGKLGVRMLTRGNSHIRPLDRIPCRSSVRAAL